MLSNTLSRIHGSLLHNPTRPSALFNEDDFDYAIELLPDDEYRQVAEMLPDIIDFDDVDFAAYEQGYEDEEWNNPGYLGRQSEPGLNFNSNGISLNNNKGYDTRITGLGTNNNHGGIHIVSKEKFRESMSKLREERKSVEVAARRSSVGFQRYFPFQSEKDAMDKFLLMLARGITITRHQSFKYAEKVSLFSSTGCRTIEWEKPGSKSAANTTVAREIKVKKKRKGLMKFWCTRRLFDVCSFVNEWCQRPVQDNSDEVTRPDETNNLNRLRALKPINSFWNAGFKRSGSFKDIDILAVVAATQEDPDDSAQLGCESIRSSRDAFNAELTFSVVYEDSTSSSTVLKTSLDIECETYDQYFVLITGFHMLKKEIATKKATGKSSDHEHDGNQPPETCWSCMLRHWATANAQLRAQQTQQETVDPASHLFAPSQTMDPLKTMQHHRRALALSPFMQRPKSTKSISHTNGSPGASSSTKKHLSQDSSNTAAAPVFDYDKPRQLPIAQFLGWTSAGTQIWARLKMAGLEVKVSFGWDLRSVVLKVRCPKWRLEQMAQQMHLKLRTRDGRLRPFRVSRRDSFQAYGIGGNIFRSSERQQIIDYILRSKIQDGGAELDEHTELGRFIVQRFPLHMYSRLVEIRRTWVTFWKQEKPGQIAEAWSPFSSSYRETWEKISSAVGYFFDHLLIQPIDSIAEYFGENIAFYFAFLSFYTRWLVIPSILGVIVFIVQMTSRKFDHWLCAPYAIVLMIWICLMLVYWRQKESSLAYRWGVLDYEVQETERPQFRGETYLDETTNEWHKSYPGWKRLLRYMVSIPIVLCAIFVTLIVMTTVFYSQHEIYGQYSRGESLNFSPSFPSIRDITHGNWTNSESATTGSDQGHNGSNGFSVSDLQDSDFWAATFFYPCLYGMITSFMTLAFDYIAVVLNEFENHKTQTTFMNRLILKVFSFQFVAIFTSLYYYAFFIKSQEASFSRIAVTIFSFMTVGQWWSVFLDICLPSLYHRALVYEMKARVSTINRRIFAVKEISDKPALKNNNHNTSDSDFSANNNSNSNNSSSYEGSYAMSNKPPISSLEEKLQKRVRYLEQARSQCWEEALQSRYNTFNDYTDLVIQLSFILFFGAIFPLAPLLALLNNLALIRCHAFKLCHTRQRPIAQKMGGIGVWSDVLQILSVGGALTNCALFGFVSTPIRQWLLPRVGQAGIALLLFGYEQVLLLFKYWLHTSVPKVPPTVQRAQLRERKSLSRKSFERARQRKGGAASAMKTNGNGNGNNSQKHMGKPSSAISAQQKANNEDDDNNNIDKKDKKRKNSSLFNWLTGVEDWADEIALQPLGALPLNQKQLYAGKNQKMPVHTSPNNNNNNARSSWSPFSQQNHGASPYQQIMQRDVELTHLKSTDSNEDDSNMVDFANGALISRQPFAPIHNANTKKKASLLTGTNRKASFSNNGPSNNCTVLDIENRRPSNLLLSSSPKQMSPKSPRSPKSPMSMIAKQRLLSLGVHEEEERKANEEEQYYRNNNHDNRGVPPPPLSDYFAFGNDDEDENNDAFDDNNDHENEQYYEEDEDELGPPSEDFEDEGEEYYEDEKVEEAQEEDWLRPGDYGAVEIDGAIMDDYDEQEDQGENEDFYEPPPDEDFYDDGYENNGQYYDHTNQHDQYYEDDGGFYEENDDVDKEDDERREECSELTFNDFEGFDEEDYDGINVYDNEAAQPFSAHYLYSSGLLMLPPQTSNNTHAMNGNMNGHQNKSKFALQHAQLRQLQQNLQQRRVLRLQKQHQQQQKLKQHARAHNPHPQNTKTTNPSTNKNIRGSLQQQQPMRTSTVVSPSRNTAGKQNLRASAAAGANTNNNRRVSNQSSAKYLANNKNNSENHTNGNNKAWMMSLTAAALPSLTKNTHQPPRASILTKQHQQNSNTMSPKGVANKRSSVSPSRSPNNTNINSNNNLLKSKPLVLLSAYNPQTDSPFNYTSQPNSDAPPPPPAPVSSPPRSPKNQTSTKQINASCSAKNISTPIRGNNINASKPPTPARQHIPKTPQTNNNSNNNLQNNPFAFASPMTIAAAAKPARINFD